MFRQQLVLKWARFRSDESIPLGDDLQNLAFDTISLCTMNYRFNTFYRDEMHPYVKAMNTRLAGAGASKIGVGVLNRALKLFGVNEDVPDQAELDAAQNTMDRIGQ